MKTHVKALQVLVLVTAFVMANMALGKGATLKFESMVTAIEQTAANEGTITLQAQGFDVPVLVIETTSIRAMGDDVSLDAIQVGDVVRAEAYFADAGIVAEEIRLVNTHAEVFYLKGRISAVEQNPVLLEATETDASGELTLITVVDTDVYISEETRITRRHSGQGNSVPASELSVGDEVSVAGKFDGVLWAERVHVGSQQLGEIEIEGSITELTETSFTITMKKGGTAVVTYDETTEIVGELALESDVEVEGRLNAELGIDATEIVVDGREPLIRIHGRGDDDDEDDEADDDSDAVATVRAMLQAGIGSDVSGTMKTESTLVEGRFEEKFATTVEGVPAGATLMVRIFADGEIMELNDVVADASGKAVVRFVNVSDDSAGSILPAGISVRDITGIQIFMNGTLVLERNFE